MNISDVRKLASDNRQTYYTEDEIREKLIRLEEALKALKKEIIIRLENKDESTYLRRILSIRDGSKEKSLYECINQLPHYVYCLHAAAAIINSGNYESINILPTANGNNNGFDIEARVTDGKMLIGEVFSVSKKLFGGKKSKTVNKLLKYEQFVNTNVCVFVNAEARDTEITFTDKDAERLQKKKCIHFYSISPEGKIKCLTRISNGEDCPIGLV